MGEGTSSGVAAGRLDVPEAADCLRIMQTGKSSATAFRVALQRAAHQLLDTPKILDDPLALPILGVDAAKRLHADLKKEGMGASRALRTTVVVRSRAAEDALTEAVVRGVRQYVILGAGLDTSAYRHPHRGSGLRIFEVDYPATQSWKRRLLEDAGIAPPPELSFVPIDFERQKLAEQLRAAGFEETGPTFFSWLGLTPYLTREAIFDTLQFIASLPKGTGVVFDYGIALSELNFRGKFIQMLVKRRVAKVGEPWRTMFVPAELLGALRATGFAEATDLGPELLNARYCRNRADGLKVGPLLHVMTAAV